MSGFKVATTAETFWALYHRVRSGEPFVYTRYGDGDMNIMLGGGGGGQSPDGALAGHARQLFELEDPRNMVGLALHQHEDGMTDGIFESWAAPVYEQFKLPRRFESAIALHAYAARKPHLLRMFFELIRDQPKILVSANGDDDPNIVRLIGRYTSVRVPELDAYSTFERWYPEIVAALPTSRIVLFACGPAKCAAAKFFLESNVDVQAIDLGSVIDLAQLNIIRTWITLVPPEARKVLLGG